ncbi:hypothetical protein [Chryseobacterium sp. SIMBA_038]|uniref:hypothetical protein n=1 Tax=Chryseobacterium sp. SIMBA_038 TaxID=3085780 RepID=UPI003978A0DB
MKKTFMLAFVVSLFSIANAQVGIDTPTPKASLDVTGKPANSSSLDGIIPPRITGDQLRAKTYTTSQTGAQVYVTAADSAPAGQTVNVRSIGNYYFDGNVWKYMPGTDNTLPNGTGSLVMINGVVQVAQEMSMRLANDWTIPVSASNPAGVGSTNRNPIGQMTVKLIDNYNTFTSTATTNAFTVKNDGTYLVGMNFPIQVQSNGPLNGNLYYGIFNVTDNTWVTFGLDTVVNLLDGQVKNYSYLVSVDLLASKTYSFYIGQQTSNTPVLLMRGLSTINGNNSLTFFSVKRLK